MITSYERAELDGFRDCLAGAFGLELGEDKLDFLAEVLRRRVEACGLSPSAYLEFLGSRGGQDELRVLASEVTVTETYFFRGVEQCRALAEAVLPEIIRRRSAECRLRLLSAGCASGDEAYTLAILLREHFPQLHSWDIAIHGVDVNRRMVALARQGKYAAWALRETPAEIRGKYFHTTGGKHLLEERIRSMVSFEERNLAAPGNGFWPGENRFDLVLCRNVLMYLLPSAAQQVIARLSQALAPGGFLFLGYAETLRGLSQDFQLRHTHECFYYQKSRPGDVEPANGAAWRSAPAAGLSWVDAVRETCERIDRLAQPASGPATSVGGPPAGAASAGQIARAFELHGQERFAEALELLDRLSAEGAGDADTQLLRAVLLTNSGDVEGAEAICRQLLGADDLNASAHYLMALCRERAGDLACAMEHDRAAIYLDATFAMPHLHLGRLARQASDWATARSELRRAAMLLLRENSARILLFGGGFRRETLVACCRAELTGTGVRA